MRKPESMLSVSFLVYREIRQCVCTGFSDCIALVMEEVEGQVVVRGGVARDGGIGGDTGGGRGRAGRDSRRGGIAGVRYKQRR